jgi:hypothetical protein
MFLIIRIIIFIGMRHPIEFLRFLALLEYGVSIFCLKMSERARLQGHFNLAKLLSQHSVQEHKHGVMLASLADGKNKIKPSGNGRWLTLKKVDTGEELARFPDKGEGTEVFLPNQNLLGVFQNLDGLSQRYLSLKILFLGKKAEDFEWTDTLAFMSALETVTKRFYTQLALSTEAPLSTIAQQISEDESQHSEYLKICLSQFTHFPEVEIDRWRARIRWATIGLVIDGWRYLWL